MLLIDNDFVQKWAGKVGVTLRELDKALFAYDKYYDIYGK